MMGSLTAMDRDGRDQVATADAIQHPLVRDVLAHLVTKEAAIHTRSLVTKAKRIARGKEIDKNLSLYSGGLQTSCHPFDEMRQFVTVEYMAYRLLHVEGWLSEEATNSNRYPHEMFPELLESARRRYHMTIPG